MGKFLRQSPPSARQPHPQGPWDPITSELRTRLYWKTMMSIYGCFRKSSILIGFSIIDHPIWGTTIFGNIHIEIYLYKRGKLTPLEKPEHFETQWQRIGFRWFSRCQLGLIVFFRSNRKNRPGIPTWWRESPQHPIPGSESFTTFEPPCTFPKSHLSINIQASPVLLLQ